MIRRLREIRASLAVDPSLLREAADVLHQMRQEREALIRQLAIQENEKLELKLQYTNWGRGILEQFHVMAMRGELDDEMLANIENAITDLKDEEARLSEFVQR